jgi:AraC-like DNA-binding protein
LYPPFEIGRQQRNHSLVLVTLKGQAHFRTPDVAMTLKPGMLCCVPGSMPRHYILKRGNWQMLWVHLHNHAPWDALTRDLLVVRDIPQADIRLAWQAMFSLHHEHQHARHDSQALCQSLSDAIITFLARYLIHQADPETQWLRQQLVGLTEKVANTPGEDWRIQRMARMLHVSGSQLHRYTRRIFNQTPMQVVTRIRMEHAQRLLAQTNWRLDVIAQRVGYVTAFAFSRTFSRHFGLSPRQYRQQIK